jgi:hypothetical protein
MWVIWEKQEIHTEFRIPEKVTTWKTETKMGGILKFLSIVLVCGGHFVSDVELSGSDTKELCKKKYHL